MIKVVLKKTTKTNIHNLFLPVCPGNQAALLQPVCQILLPRLQAAGAAAPPGPKPQSEEREKNFSVYLHLSNLFHKFDKVGRSLTAFLDGLTSYLENELDGEERMGALASFLAEFDVRLQDRRFCRWRKEKKIIISLHSWSWFATTCLVQSNPLKWEMVGKQTDFSS